MAVAEVVAYSYGYSSVIAAATFLGSQELAPAVAHTQEHPEVVWLIVLSAAAGYVSTACVLALVKHYSSAVAELAKSLRKCLSVVISFIVYSKPIKRMHIAGMLLFVTSVWLERAFPERASKAQSEATSGPQRRSDRRL